MDILTFMKNNESVINQIERIVDRETTGWQTKDVEKLLSIFHPDFVWVWPPTNKDHDPITWESPLGRFDQKRWRDFYAAFFSSHTLVHNHRETKKIVLTKDGRGAFAVVDIDTLWKDKQGNTAHWFGRVCKVYSLVRDDWKLIMHTGTLVYP